MVRNARYRRLLSARTVSLLGSAIAPIALAFAILGLRHGSPSELGIVLASRSIGQVAFLLIGGVLADRFSRYRVMVASDILAGAAQAGVAALFISHRTTLAALIALSTINGAAAALFYPASASVIPQVVDVKDLQPANALLRMSTNASAIAGAVVAGALIAAVGSGWAIAADAASFFASALLLVGLRIAPVAHPVARRGMFEDLRHGWREFRSRTWVWVTVVQFSLLNACFAGGINVLGPVVAQRHYGGAAGFSALRACQAAGFLGGSFVALRLRPRRPLRLATAATFAFVAPLLLLAAAAPLWLVAAAMTVDGVCADIFEVLWSVALQTHVPDEALSRVNSYDALGSFALGPLGMAAAGPVAEGIGVTETLIAGGVLAGAATAAALTSRSVRSLTAGPDPPPDPPPQHPGPPAQQPDLPG